MKDLVSLLITSTLTALLILASIIPHQFAKAQDKFAETEFVEEGKPKLFDLNLKITTIAEGLSTPTTMAFIGLNDILVLEKDTGMVKRIINGKVLAKPVLDVNVANSIERCLCGIATSKDGSKTYVFIYYTEIDGKDGSDRESYPPFDDEPKAGKKPEPPELPKEEKKGFSWGSLLVAAVAVVAVVAVASH